MLTPPLSLQLREGTREHHRLAETTPFIRAFFQGNFSLAEYRFFLLQLFHVYNAMEDKNFDFSKQPVIGILYFADLLRVPQLEKDLDHFYVQTNWRNIEPNPDTMRYLERINYLKIHDPLLLAAHTYTRYLGDLSGGQAMKKILTKAYPHEAEYGINFYEFPNISDFDTFKNEYRQQLDSLSISQDKADEIVLEAQSAFELNRQLTENLLSFIAAG